MFGTKVRPLGEIPVVEVQMTPDEARKVFDTYDSFLKRQDAQAQANEIKVVTVRSAEGRTVAQVPSQRALDERVRDAHWAIASGEKVIDLAATFSALGVDGKERPRIAISRADWRMVFLTRSNAGSFILAAGPASESRRPPDWTEYDFPFGTLPRCRETFYASALAPMIPPPLRPDNLSDFAVLFEPTWKGEMPPRVIDPILLRPLGGMLYVVIAHWDLTAIEASVLGAL